MKPTRITSAKWINGKERRYTCDNDEKYALQGLLKVIGITQSTFNYRISKHGLRSKKVFSPPLNRFFKCKTCGKRVKRKGVNHQYCNKCAAKRAEDDNRRYRERNKHIIAKKRMEKSMAAKNAELTFKTSPEKEADRRKFQEWNRRRKQGASL